MTFQLNGTWSANSKGNDILLTTYGGLWLLLEVDSGINNRHYASIALPFHSLRLLQMLTTENERNNKTTDTPTHNSQNHIEILHFEINSTFKNKWNNLKNNFIKNLDAFLLSPNWSKSFLQDIARVPNKIIVADGFQISKTCLIVFPTEKLAGKTTCTGEGRN